MARRKLREANSKFFGTKQVLRDLNQAAHLTAHDLDPTVASLPTGGSTDYVLTKASSADFDVEWAVIPVSSNLDGGAAASVYGGTTAISGGGA